MPNGRILVVDDEVNIRDLVAMMLRRAGHSVVTASNANAAISILGTDPFIDLVLTDLMMGETDGFSLLDGVCKQHPHVPVLMLTGTHDLSTAMAAVRRGAFDYLLKPFQSEQLTAAVNRGMEHRRRVQQHEQYKMNLEFLVQSRTRMLNETLADLEHSYDVTLEALGAALDLRDAETEGHSKRVTAYTIALARVLCLGADELRIIARGAFLHDIGKMAIPDSILLKPGKLTFEEMEVMKEHAALGYKMIRKIRYLRDAADIVLSHQERFDGMGYPRKLSGAEIPLGARIFAIADTLDAITSDRPYRKADSFAFARTEIAKNSGTQFDPEIVEVFLKVPDALWQDLRTEINQHTEESQLELCGV